MNKKKIIYFNSSLLKGGTDIYMVEIIRNIDKEKFSVDVIIKDGDTIDNVLYEELKSLGCEIYLAKGGFLDRMKYLMNFFKKSANKYNVAHINATSGATGIIAYFAKKFGKIENVIFHSHMGGNDNKTSIIDKIGINLLKKNADIYAACSKVAAQFMYGKKFVQKENILILNNSVDVDKFDFNVSIRKKMRKSYGLENSDFALLHVGRFVEQKNHLYLIKVFKELLETSENQNYKLFLIGDGKLKNEIVHLISELHLENNVILLGLQNNVSDFMQMADCFVMTSIHEGLPIVAVEAQASGMPCILSSNISIETNIVGDGIDFVSIGEDNKNEWVKKIKACQNFKRKSTKAIMIDKHFDSHSVIKDVENLYLR